jgi:hypothetical protein
MNKQQLIIKLESIVKARTPQYVSRDCPQYDETLLKAHALLANLYEREGKKSAALSHLKDAAWEFSIMCDVELHKHEYISGGLEGFRKSRAQERETERKLENYKEKLFGIANKMGYNAANLLSEPSRLNRDKKNNSWAEL